MDLSDVSIESLSNPIQNASVPLLDLSIHSLTLAYIGEVTASRAHSTGDTHELRSQLQCCCCARQLHMLFP